MSHLTPIVNAHEPLVGQKTRFVRGAVPYCNYAAGYILRELGKLEDVDESQDAVTEVGSGGGIQIGQHLAKGGDFVRFGKKFLLPKADASQLAYCAEYFSTRCMQAVGDRLWKTCFPVSIVLLVHIHKVRKRLISRKDGKVFCLLLHTIQRQRLFSNLAFF